MAAAHYRRHTARLTSEELARERAASRQRMESRTDAAIERLKKHDAPMVRDRKGRAVITIGNGNKVWQPRVDPRYG